MTAPVRADLRPVVVTAAAVIVLAIGSTFAFAMARQSQSRGPNWGAACRAPTLSGEVVDASLADMSGMMGGRGQGGWRRWHAGMMRVAVTPSAVLSGTVSLRVTNTGYLAHEVVVLPLAAGQSAGTRPVHADGTVNEADSLGEVAADCGGAGDEGISPSGGVGWTTLTLPNGRYEVLCNLPGHYRAGMYAELNVR